MDSGFEWITDPEDAFGTLVEAYAVMLYNAAWTICESRAPEIEAWMKDNAPWTDRTGNARRTLFTRVVQELSQIVVLLSHGMPYGFWLEVKFAGRDGIIAPAVDYWAPKIIADIQRAFQTGTKTLEGGMFGPQREVWQPTRRHGDYGVGYLG